MKCSLVASASPLLIVALAACVGSATAEPKPSTITEVEASGDNVDTLSDPSRAVSVESSPAPADPNEPDSRPQSLDEAVLFDDSAAKVIFDAQELLISRCMADQGFVYPVSAFQETPPRPGYYPPDDLLARHGYAWRAYVRIPSPPSQLGQKTPEYLRALEGEDSAIGCGEASVLSLELQRLFSIQQQFYNAQAEVDAAVEADNRNAPLAASWSTCLTGRGYSYDRPAGAEEAGLNSPDGPESPASVQLAIQDYSCRQETRYAESRSVMRKDAVQNWLESNPELLAELVSAEQVVLERAKRVLSEGG